MALPENEMKSADFSKNGHIASDPTVAPLFQTASIKLPIPSTDTANINVTVFFILGGPGAGKGTQCAKLSQAIPAVSHLNVGDVLREEMLKPDSKYGEVIKRNMQEGRVGPKEITLELLRNAMLKMMKQSDCTMFLIDGFPRKMDQALLFEAAVIQPSHVIVFECPEEVLTDRLLKRANLSSRLDNTIDIIQKRLRTFKETTAHVIMHYESQGKLTRINAALDQDTVFKALRERLWNTLDQAS